LWVATSVVVSYLADALRIAHSSLCQKLYSEYYCNLVAAWVHTLQDDKLVVQLNDRTVRHFDVLDTFKLKNAPDSEAKNVLYGKMRQAVTAFPGERSERTLPGATATLGKPVKCGSRSTRPRSTAFAFVTFVSSSTGRWTRTRHSRWLESL